MIGKIYISGQIGTFDGVTGIELIDVIGQVKAQPEAIAFDVHINSEGGIMDIGFDIYNYLKSLKKPITTIGSGMVASIATVIFMAGDKRLISNGTEFMIHLPWAYSAGTADELEALAKEARDYEKKLIDFYKKSLDLTDEAIHPLLREESWLTKEQLQSLGFLTSEPLKIVAKAVLKSKTNDKMSDTNFTEKDRHWMENLFNSVLAKFKPKVVNKLVQDATGTELDFQELEDADAVEIGAMAMVDGSPAEGEYVLPDGTTYVFSAGALTEIIEAEEENTEMQDRINELEEQLNMVTAERDAFKNQFTEVENDVKKLKAQVISKYGGTGKKNPKRDTNEPKDRAEGLRTMLNEKKNK